MKQSLFFVVLTCLIMGCDPVHDLKLENKTGEAIEVVYHPRLDTLQLKGKVPELVNLEGMMISKIILQPGESITIGTVIAKYIPDSTDIDIDYLRIAYSTDTMRLAGKGAIYSRIQKVKKLDWRLVMQ